MIGDAAHPTSSHVLPSTNIPILDAAVLGKCIEDWVVGNLHSALEPYQPGGPGRLPVTSKQVLHSMQLGVLNKA